MQSEPAAEQSTLGGPSIYQGGQNLKLSAQAAVFIRVSLLIGGPGSLLAPAGKKLERDIFVCAKFK